MSEVNTKSIAMAFNCTTNSNCVTQVEKYINEQPQKVFDSYTCSVHSVMNGSGGRTEYLQALLVICSGTPKVALKKP